jgi:hypothetical protein
MTKEHRSLAKIEVRVGDRGKGDPLHASVAIRFAASTIVSLSDCKILFKVPGLPRSMWFESELEKLLVEGYRRGSSWCPEEEACVPRFENQ